MVDATRANTAGAQGGALARLAALGPTYGALIALVLLFVGNCLFTTNFNDVNNFKNILVEVTPKMLVAVGMTLVIATGGIDLSVGSVMAVASALVAINLDLGLGVAVLFAMLAATAVGTLNGLLISGFRIQPIIVTLGMLIAGRGAAQLMNSGKLIPFTNPTFEYLGKGMVGPLPLVGGVPVQVLVMFAVVALGVFVVRASAFGRYVVAVGGNEAASRLAGIKVHRTKISVYALSALLAGLAGLIETSRLGASDAAKVGLNIELDAIAAVVVGGTPLTGGRATVVGTLVGALIMQVITTSFNMNGFAYSWSLVIKAAIIVVAVYIQRPRPA